MKLKLSKQQLIKILSAFYEETIEQLEISEDGITIELNSFEEIQSTILKDFTTFGDFETACESSAPFFKNV